MSPRTGRPRAEKPKNLDIKVRIDVDMNELLMQYCERHSITRAEAIRRGIAALLELDE